MPNDNNYALEALNINKKYGDFVALNDCELKIKQGEIIAIIGPSGSGKSTLLRCLNLLEVPNKGSITLHGETVFDADKDKTSSKYIKNARNKITASVGMVFQSFNLFPNYTAQGNVSIALRVAKNLPKNEADEKAITALEQVGLADKATSYPVQLSGGQKQRVAIARAVAMDPSILLYDEPTSALDPELVGEVLNTIKRLAKDGITKVIVTHEMEFAREIADWVIFMEKGTIIETGTSKQVFESPRQERTSRFISRLMKKD